LATYIKKNTLRRDRRRIRSVAQNGFARGLHISKGMKKELEALLRKALGRNKVTLRTKN
jgi:hypothetical protein